MPFTPYHFGPGTLIKSVIPKYFSLIIFIFVQVIIDFETLYHLLMHHHPLHQLLHTYVGSSIVVVAAVFVFRPIYNFFNDEITFLKAMISAMIGAYSHIFLDSIMHLDMKPLAPFSSVNKMWRFVVVDQLYFLCILSGLVGLGIFLIRWGISKIKK